MSKSKSDLNWIYITIVVILLLILVVFLNNKNVESFKGAPPAKLKAGFYCRSDTVCESNSCDLTAQKCK